jgi:hypothetical protein
VRALIGINKARLRYHACMVGSSIRLHQPADKRVGRLMIGLILDND